MTDHTINLHGLKLEVGVSHTYTHKACQSASQATSDWDATGYRELEWTFIGGKDEIGENLSFRSLDFIAKEYESEIEAAIWKRIEEEQQDVE